MFVASLSALQNDSSINTYFYKIVVLSCLDDLFIRLFIYLFIHTM